MARVNRWKQFGDAFNAVYNAGTQLGQAFDAGRIAIKDYEDEEGNKLSGVALDRARTDDYAAAEQKWGDPMEALRMRMGVETLGQNKLQTDYLTDTYDERVWQGGLGKTQKMKVDMANTRSRTGLNVANTKSRELATKIRGLSQEEEVVAAKAKFGAETAENIGLAKAYEDESFPASKIAEQEKNAAQASAQADYFSSDTYKNYLNSKGLADTAENKRKFVESEINRAVLESPEYQDNYIGNELAKIKRTKTMSEIELAIAQDPGTFEIAKNQLLTDVNNSNALLANSQVLAAISTDENVMKNQVQTGITRSETELLSSQEQKLLAEKSLRINTYIEEWRKTANAEDPTSMYRLIEGLKTIDPEYAMQLEKNYGEHELWEIMNTSLLMKAKLNDAMQTDGARGAMRVLDEHNGDKFGVQIRETEDGGFEMVETRPAGPGGQETEVVRTIAKGPDEKAFIQDLYAASDPASLLEYSKSLADIKYKEALTQFSNAQSKAALAKKPLTMDQWATSILTNKKSTRYEKQLALALALKDNPEAYTQMVQMMNEQELVDTAKNNNSEVGPKVTPVVDLNAPKTEQESLSAEAVINNLNNSLQPDSENAMSIDDLESYLEENSTLIAKYKPGVLISTRTKLDAAKEFLEDIKDKKDTPITAEDLQKFLEKVDADATKPLAKGPARKNALEEQEKAQQIANAFGEDPTGILNIVIAEIESNMTGPARGMDKAGLLKKRNDAREIQIEALRKLVADLLKDR
jgi:hypothetical protein